MLVEDIERFWESRALELGPEEGFRFGDPTQQLTGIGVAWMATIEVIREASERGLNCLIVHEDLFFPPGYARAELEPHLSNPVNLARLRALTQTGVCVFRAHSSIDRLCVLDDFRRALGLPEPVIAERMQRICEIQPMTAGDLASQVKERLRLESVRFVGDPERLVRRVGLPWGGLGLSINAGYVSECMQLGAEILVAGEVDDYTMRAAVDVGVPIIETSHAESENIGLAHFVELLQDAFPGTPACFLECRRPWQTM